VQTVIECLDLVFGRGDDDYPFWLLAVRVNIVVFLACAVLALVGHARSGSARRMEPAAWWMLAGLTVLAAILRFAVVPANLFDFGGVPYSRLLYGYRGYFATAQFYSPWYQLTARDLEHGILFQRIVATLTIPLIYGLCRAVGGKLFAALAALLFALYPLHLLFSASDSLSVFTTFLAAAAYLLVAGARTRADRRVAALHYWGGFAGLALLTQARPENVLLVVPAVLFVLLRRGALRRELTLPLAVALAFAAIYACQALAMGLPRQNPVDLERGLNLTIEHLVLNPFMAIPLLLSATAAVGVFRGWRWAVLAALPWAAVPTLCVLTVEDGHGAARIYANWLILMLPPAAYGISLMWGAPRRGLRLLAAAAVIYLAWLPVAVGSRLTTQYLEIIEHERFRSALAGLPDGVERVIVPDDELMWRQHGSTLELYRKYAAIFAAYPETARNARLTALTEYLDDPGAMGCARGACVFFAGVPCMDQALYAVTRGQCETLLRTSRATLLAEAEITAAPFVACSVYAGELKRRLCDPATAARAFRLYTIDPPVVPP
jgi:hypothetical protein